MTSSTAEVLTLTEALCGALGSPSAHRLARLLDYVEADLSRLTTEGLVGPYADDFAWVTSGLDAMEASRIRFWDDSVERMQVEGVSVITAGVDSYPLNLRLVPNRPPVLFVRGTTLDSDVRAIAVVGTRKPTSDGQEKAAAVAGRLAKVGVTVVSGLAEGVDSIAHRAALDAGGRTIAVFGTGIDRMFPKSNGLLATEIAAHGATVSQWWPGQAGTRWTFPLRNIVTSGLALGTVVVEATESSGARLQAEEARRHGRRLFLLKHVTKQPWATALVGQPGVHVVERVGEIMELIELDLDTESFSFA